MLRAFTVKGSRYENFIIRVIRLPISYRSSPFYRSTQAMPCLCHANNSFILQSSAVESSPGECFQIDWAHFGVLDYEGDKRKLYAFCCVECNTVKADSQSVVIYDKDREVARYARSWRRGQSLGAFGADYIKNILLQEQSSRQLQPVLHLKDSRLYNIATDPLSVLDTLSEHHAG